MTNTAALQKENNLLRKQLASHDEQLPILNEKIKYLLSKRFAPSS